VRTPLKIAAGLIRTTRPHQLVKNLFVLAPVVFAKEIFDPDLLWRAAGAFITFSLLTGAVYTMNDLVDASADREHPVKRFRPIASGLVPLPVARIFAVCLVALGLGGAATGPLSFLLTLAAYFVLNIAYSFKLKQVPYIDVGIIAVGFVLRVAAGGFGTHIQVSNYLFACTAMLALFLGFGKRRHELSQALHSKKKKQRAVLEAYTKGGLNWALGLTSLATIGTYLAYTLDPHTRQYFGSEHLWWTTLFVVLAVLRFLHLVRKRPDAESPTQEMLRDGPFVAVVLTWGVFVLWIVYNLKPAS
jgi:4-hydroxybenzoate polyprenyltransferase